MKKILYLGLTHPYHPLDGEIIYYPIIKIVPRSLDDLVIKEAFKNFDQYTHLIFTSKTTIPLLFSFATALGISEENISKKKFSQSADQLELPQEDMEWLLQFLLTMRPQKV